MVFGYVIALLCLVASVIFALLGEYDKAAYMVGLSILNHNVARGSAK